MLNNENTYIINIICKNTCKYIDSFKFLTKFKFLIKYLSYYGAHLEFFVDFRKKCSDF